MYIVKPKGINIRQNERDVADGFLQESINLQWRDGAYRPIPDRLYSGIDLFILGSTYRHIILHKVSDEDKINVLGFSYPSSSFLYWIGVIEDGEYTQLPLRQRIDYPVVTDHDSLSFTILNSLIYFMSDTEEFYYRLQFNEVDDVYEAKDMYAWKELIPFYPNPGQFDASFLQGSDTDFLSTRCGVILYRFSLVLKTGEEVLPSPIYATSLWAINRAAASIKKDDILTNIHTVINTNLEFASSTVFEEEISAINVYASIPYYVTKVAMDTVATLERQTAIDQEEAKGEVQRMAEEPFYLVKTIDKPGADEFEKNVLFNVGDLDIDIDYSLYDISKINMDTIAAGQPMPIDNFTYHKLFGKITSNNGRLIINKPKTVLSRGHIRALATVNVNSKVGFHIDTEDGSRRGVAYQIDKGIVAGATYDFFGGLLSYPDSRGNYVGGNALVTDVIQLFKIRKNKGHNMACMFDFFSVTFGVGTTPVVNVLNIDFSISGRMLFSYKDADITTVADPPLINDVFYTSENRVQFSEAGEFTVWPAINSYRVGEGKIQFIGSNSVDPSNASYIAPLIIGTSDGIYTVNFSSTGNVFIQSITKAANMPALSSESIQVDQAIVYVSDKGLIAINGGQIVNLTKDYFPEQGNGNFPAGDTVFPNYEELTTDFFGSANPYVLSDIVDYMKGAIFAYDGRRSNLWCSNPNKTFSLIYNLVTKQWDMSTYVFSKVVEFYGTLNTTQGDIYSRFLIINSVGDLDILSGEDPTTQVETHLLTRPIKIQTPDQYKKIERLISRCELYKTTDGYFTFGLWGKQDLNRDKVNIPLVAYKDDTVAKFPNNIRQDIPVGRQKGKYKTITILQGGKLLPNSSLNGFEIVAIPVDNNLLR